MLLYFHILLWKVLIILYVLFIIFISCQLELFAYYILRLIDSVILKF